MSCQLCSYHHMLTTPTGILLTFQLCVFVTSLCVDMKIKFFWSCFTFMNLILLKLLICCLYSLDITVAKISFAFILLNVHCSLHIYWNSRQLTNLSRRVLHILATHWIDHSSSCTIHDTYLIRPKNILSMLGDKTCCVLPRISMKTKSCHIFTQTKHFVILGSQSKLKNSGEGFTSRQLPHNSGSTHLMTESVSTRYQLSATGYSIGKL